MSAFGEPSGFDCSVWGDTRLDVMSDYANSKPVARLPVENRGFLRAEKSERFYWTTSVLRSELRAGSSARCADNHSFSPHELDFALSVTGQLGRLLD